MPLIQAANAGHGAMINDLAKEGKIAPVEFTAADGIRRKANSVWAATDWLSGVNGGYDPEKLPVRWHL